MRFIRPKKFDLSTPMGRAMKDLYDPKWSWNRFPRRQMNFVSYYTKRYTGVDLYHIARSIRRFFTGTYTRSWSK